MALPAWVPVSDSDAEPGRSYTVIFATDRRGSG
jgi:hypothetical protein